MLCFNTLDIISFTVYILHCSLKFNVIKLGELCYINLLEKVKNYNTIDGTITLNSIEWQANAYYNMILNFVLKSK